MGNRVRGATQEAFHVETSVLEGILKRSRELIRELAQKMCQLAASRTLVSRCRKNQKSSAQNQRANGHWEVPDVPPGVGITPYAGATMALPPVGGAISLLPPK